MGDPAVWDAAASDTCRVSLTLVASDESLARIIGVLRRKLWSVLELHHARHDDRDELQLTARKAGGQADLLIAALRREVVVIDVAPL